MSSTTPPLARRRSATTILGVALMIFAIGIVAVGFAPPAAAEPGSRTGAVTNQGVRTASSLPSPAVSAVASVRCVAGKAVLVTRVTNTGDAPATITIASAWGTKTHVGVAAGATVATTASTRASAVEAGTVELTVGAPSGSRTASAPFAATRCGSSPLAPVGVGANQEIRNQQNTLCLDDIAFDTRPGADVRQWTCQEGQNQLWAVTDLGNGFAEIKNTHSALCLQNIAAVSGSGVRQWTCSRDDAQQWQLTDVGGGWTEIRNRHNNLCVTSDASPVDGVLLSQQTCNGSGVQRWRLTDPNVSKMTYTLYRSANPTADEADAYARITDAMDRAIARYNKFNNTQRHLTVEYNPGVQTADATISGHIRFGSNRGFMQEGTALHEISHTVGVGTAGNFQTKCDAQDWPAALPLLRSWDGPDARITCGGSHFWPYGLNYSNEYSELNFDRNVRLVQAMQHDGL